tara:strand:- start:735 stop:1346 length:612 start_codon:yes stop_codon:yes gene_type:complete
MHFHYKNYFSLLALLIVTSLNGQKKKTTEIYDLKTSFAETKAMYKADFYITKSLIFEDGSSISIGDTLPLGPSSSKISNTYETIATGRTTIIQPISKYSQVNTSMREFDWVLETIKGTRLLGDLDIEMFIRNPDASGLAQKYLTININSFTMGEVVNPNRRMTRNEAIDKLKESKELLELEIISQEEYDAIKKKLTPIIMKDN